MVFKSVYQILISRHLSKKSILFCSGNGKFDEAYQIIVVIISLSDSYSCRLRLLRPLHECVSVVVRGSDSGGSSEPGHSAYHQGFGCCQRHALQPSRSIARRLVSLPLWADPVIACFSAPVVDTMGRRRSGR